MPSRRPDTSSGARSSGIPARSQALPPKPSGRVKLVDSAYHAIRRRILDNVYPQGHQLLEEELAAELNMSRTPVREALVRLEHESLVQLKGARTRHLKHRVRTSREIIGLLERHRLSGG